MIFQNLTPCFLGRTVSIRFLLLSTVLIFASISISEADDFSNSQQQNYSEYLSSKYINNTIDRIRTIIDQRGEESNSNITLDKALDMVSGPIIDEIEALVSRTRNITGAVLRLDQANNKLQSCDYFMLSVSLSSIKMSLSELSNCKNNECTPKEINTNVNLLAMEYKKINNLLIACPTPNDK